MLPDGRLVLAGHCVWCCCAVLAWVAGQRPCPSHFVINVLCHAAEYEDEDYYRSVTAAQLQDGKHIETEIYVWIESKR